MSAEPDRTDGPDGPPEDNDSLDEATLRGADPSEEDSDTMLVAPLDGHRMAIQTKAKGTVIDRDAYEWALQQTERAEAATAVKTRTIKVGNFLVDGAHKMDIAKATFEELMTTGEMDRYKERGEYGEARKEHPGAQRINEILAEKAQDLIQELGDQETIFVEAGPGPDGLSPEMVAVLKAAKNVQYFLVEYDMESCKDLRAKVKEQGLEGIVHVIPGDIENIRIRDAATREPIGVNCEISCMTEHHMGLLKKSPVHKARAERMKHAAGGISKFLLIDEFPMFESPETAEDLRKALHKIYGAQIAELAAKRASVLASIQERLDLDETEVKKAEALANDAEKAKLRALDLAIKDEEDSRDAQLVAIDRLEKDIKKLKEEGLLDIEGEWPKRNEWEKVNEALLQGGRKPLSPSGEWKEPLKGEIDRLEEVRLYIDTTDREKIHEHFERIFPTPGDGGVYFLEFELREEGIETKRSTARRIWTAINSPDDEEVF